MSDRRRILFVQHAANLTGSTFSGAQICRAMIAMGWDVDVVFGHEGDALDLYRGFGCDVDVVPHKNWLSGATSRMQAKRWIGEAQATKAFAQIIARFNPDLVYVNSLVSASAVLAAKLHRVPRIWHLRELFDDVGGEMIIPPIGGRFVADWIIRSLPDRLVSPSQAIIDNLFGRVKAPAVVDVVPNAADAEFFDALPDRNECRAQWNVPADATVIGVPGTLRPVKGHPFFLSAFASIAANRPGLHALISGEPCDADYVRQLDGSIATHGLQSRVHLTGSVHDMRRFYAACDLACVPSRSESFGRTAVESFATRVPLVGSNVGGIAEIIRDNETGLLVSYGDVAALSAALERLLDDAALRDRLSKAARSDAEERFHESGYARRIVSIVQRLLAEHAAPQLASSKHNRVAVS